MHFHEIRDHDCDEDEVDPVALLVALHRKVNAMADALADAFAALQSQVADLQTDEVAASTELQALVTVVQGITPGTALTADQVTALTSTVSDVATALKSATDSAVAGTTPAPPVVPAA